MENFFTISELCKSTTASEKGIDNTPTPEIENKLQDLIDDVPNPVRKWYGSPIYVNSGYRCPELNKAVGGVSTSQHQKGEAVDIDTRNHENNVKIFNWIKDNLVYDQLIWENNGAWIHVSYKKDGKNRMQVLDLK